MLSFSIKRMLFKTITAFGAVALSVTIGAAGDFSTLNVLGFSKDGATFAFEEYGIQDGSGAAYATRSYIDTASDNYVGGSPFRIQAAESEQELTLDIARAKAKQLGEQVIADDALQSGYIAGFNAVTETSADPFRMSVNPRPVVPPIDDEIVFQLEEQKFKANGICADVLNGSVTGFALTAFENTAGQTIHTLHEDKSVPSSRNCPSGYRIGAVYTYFGGGSPTYAVVLSVRSFGFEGPDYRWMAVTARADKLQ